MHGSCTMLAFALARIAEVHVTAPGFIAIYGTLSLLATVLSIPVASAKFRHPGYWAIAAFLFPGLFLLLLVMPKGNEVKYRERQRLERMRGMIPDDLL